MQKEKQTIFLTFVNSQKTEDPVDELSPLFLSVE